MDNPQRATVAFLCGCLHSSQKKIMHNGVQDYARGIFVPCSFTNQGGHISVFDHQRSCYLSGFSQSFFDYGFSQYITLIKVNDNLFSVYDFKTNTYLSVTCNGDAVTIFDYATSKYYNYQLN